MTLTFTLRIFFFLLAALCFFLRGFGVGGRVDLTNIGFGCVMLGVIFGGAG